MSTDARPLTSLLTFPHRVEGIADSVEILGISYDSRQVKPGFLFAALPGITSDGYDFIAAAVRNGAAAVLSLRPSEDAGTLPQIIVQNPAEALALVSAEFYGSHNEKLFLTGVTGTNGKTTITWLLRHLAGHHDLRSAVIGTLGMKSEGENMNYGLTTPMSPEIHRFLASCSDQDIHQVYMEASSIAVEQKRLFGLSFDQLIFTNLSRDHLDYHPDMEAYYQAKKSLFSQLRPDGKAFINIDDIYGERLLSELDPETSRSLSLRDSSADFHFSGLKLGRSGLSATLIGHAKELKIRAGLIGDYNAANLLAALAAFYSRYPQLLPDTLDIRDFKGAPGRMEMYECPGHGSIIVDFAHTPDAMENVFRSLKALNLPGRIVSLFGAGGNRDQGKRPIMGQTADTWSDAIILTNDNPRREDPRRILEDISKGITNTLFRIIPDRRTAIETAVREAGEEDITLILGKGGEEYQEIQGIRRAYSDSETVKEIIKPYETV